MADQESQDPSQKPWKSARVRRGKDSTPGRLIPWSAGFMQIVLYGKGGIGKSTLASNISVALNEKGLKVMQVGCSPKSHSVIFLNGRNPLETTILDYYREKGINEDKIRDTIAEGHKGILIAETGREPVYGGRENDLWMGRH